jgi:hypothetical protein
MAVSTGGASGKRKEIDSNTLDRSERVGGFSFK